MTKFLSLDWFKEKVESSIEKVISKKIESLIDESQEDPTEKDSLFLNAKLVNDTLTIVLHNGELLFKTNATEKHYKQLLKCETYEEILLLISDKEASKEVDKKIKESKKIKQLLNGFDILLESGLFTIENNIVYLNGISRSLPPLLVEKFIEILNRCKEEDIYPLDDEEFISHQRFFMWCCLNPRAEVARELYRFLTENSFRITKQGFFVALRNVVSLGTEDNNKVEFISNAYNKVKAIWKQNPNNYFVVEKNGEYILTKGEKTKHTMIGNLTKLYLDLPNMAENRFTDHWTKTFDIRVGQVVNMPLDQCDWSTQDCAAAGLHFTANQIHYVGCGDTSMLILINPMKIVGIGEHKGRCYEYLPIMTVPRLEATGILHDGMFDTLQLDEQYAIDELANLEETAKQGFVAETKKYSFNLPEISTNEIQTIVHSLKDMSKEIEGRIVKIKRK